VGTKVEQAVAEPKHVPAGDDPPVLRETSPWKRRPPLTIPPDSIQAWVRLAVWEFGMGALVSSALVVGTRLIASAPDNIVTVFDFSKCYAAPPIVEPCERVAYRAGTLNVALNGWCGLLLVAVAAWLLWQLWVAVAPTPITDEFLKLLHDSFGRNWRRPRTWPWARLGWAYGFTVIGAVLAFSLGAIVSTVISSSTPPRTPAVHVETSERFRSNR
jgi:hypothetical protein